MNPKNDLTQPRPTQSPAPRKRFRVDKLEERIAPKKGGNWTTNCTWDTHPGGGHDRRG